MGVKPNIRKKDLTTIMYQVNGLLKANKRNDLTEEFVQEIQSITMYTAYNIRQYFEGKFLIEYSKIHKRYKQAFLNDIKYFDKEDYEYFEKINITGYYLLYLFASFYSDDKPLAIIGNPIKSKNSPYSDIDNVNVKGLVNARTKKNYWLQPVDIENENHISSCKSVFRFFEEIKFVLEKYGIAYINSNMTRLKWCKEKIILNSCIAMYKFETSTKFALDSIKQLDALITKRQPIHFLVYKKGKHYPITIRWYEVYEYVSFNKKFGWKFGSVLSALNYIKNDTKLRFDEYGREIMNRNTYIYNADTGYTYF